MGIALPIPLLLLAAGCATVPPADAADGLVYARLHQTVTVGGPRVTPLTVIEDSRCPRGVACVWAGRLRISARIDLGNGSQTREFTLGVPQQVADGTLELVAASPHPIAGAATDRRAYRFGWRFAGGL